VRQDQPLTAVICLLIAGAAWWSAFAQGATSIALASAAVITALCAAITILRLPARRQLPPVPVREKPQCESSEFRRSLFNLCAALKLGIGFCERHLDSDPDILVEHLESMRDHICDFVNETVHPVRLRATSRWPWRPTRAKEER